MLNVVATPQVLSALNGATNAFPRLYWHSCKGCSRGVVARGIDDLCSTHQGATKPKFQLRQTRTGTCYLYEWDGDDYRAHHTLAFAIWLHETNSIRRVSDYLHPRHIHHVDGDTLNNRMDNLLPLLSEVHMGFGHRADARSLWELEAAVLPWMLKRKLLKSSWRPETLPAVQANRSSKDYEGISLPRR